MSQLVLLRYGERSTLLGERPLELALMFRGMLHCCPFIYHILSFTNNDPHDALDAVLGACLCGPDAADPGPLLLHRRPLPKVLL